MTELVIGAIGFLVGLGLGWFIGWRPAADWRARHEARDIEARELDEKFKSAIRDLAGASERAARADELSASLDAARTSNADLVDTLRRENATIGAQLAGLREKTANFDEQKRLLFMAQEALKKEFENAGAKVLADAQASFLNRAQERLAESEEKSAERLRTLLAPVGERLKSYEEQVATLE